jgi:hypothetical protein
MFAVIDATKAQPSALPLAGLTPATLLGSASKAPPPPARTVDQIRSTNTVVATVMDATMNIFLYLSGLIHINGTQERTNSKKATKSQTCIVPSANSVSRFAKEGHRAVKKTFRHWPPYQVFVAVQTNERKTRMLMGRR